MERLTQEQQDFIYDKTDGLELVCITVHGSVLYGLNYADSDIDVKAIYLPSKTDLLLGNALKTTNHKCDEHDIEIEIKSLSSFIKSLGKCDTNCMDMIHTPENMTLSTTDLWTDICSLRECVYAKNMKGIIGYIKTHTHKYSNKIQRLDEMKAFLSYLELVGLPVKFKDSFVYDLLSDGTLKYKYITLGTQHSDHEQAFVEVCGKKYTETWTIQVIMDAVQSEISRYGKRTNTGSNNGYDTKALSHALRALVQVEDLVINRTISFPLKELDLIKKVKFNEMELEDVMSLLEERFERVTTLLDESDLPEFNDLSPIMKLLEEYYFGKEIDITTMKKYDTTDASIIPFHVDLIITKTGEYPSVAGSIYQRIGHVCDNENSVCVLNTKCRNTLWIDWDDIEPLD